MNFDTQLSREIKQVKPKRLLDACQRFADVLANGEWMDALNREVTISRSFTEVLGTDVIVNGERIRQSSVRTKVEFEADKEEIRENDDGEIVLEEYYSMSAKIRETINPADIPDHAHAKLVEYLRNYTDEDDEEEDDAEEGDVVSLPVEVSPELLNSIRLEHELEIGYGVNEEGEIDNYYIIERYKANRDVIAESRYGLNDFDERKQYQPTLVIDDKPVHEYKLAYLPNFDEADLAEFLNTLDTIIQSILDSEQFEDITDDSYDEESKHYVRAFGIIAMSAVGFKNIKL